MRSQILALSELPVQTLQRPLSNFRCFSRHPQVRCKMPPREEDVSFLGRGRLLLSLDYFDEPLALQQDIGCFRSFSAEATDNTGPLLRGIPLHQSNDVPEALPEDRAVG